MFFRTLPITHLWNLTQRSLSTPIFAVTAPRQSCAFPQVAKKRVDSPAVVRALGDRSRQLDPRGTSIRLCYGNTTRRSRRVRVSSVARRITEQQPTRQQPAIKTQMSVSRAVSKQSHAPLSHTPVFAENAHGYANRARRAGFVSTNTHLPLPQHCSFQPPSTPQVPARARRHPTGKAWR